MSSKTTSKRKHKRLNTNETEDEHPEKKNVTVPEIEIIEEIKNDETPTETKEDLEENGLKGFDKEEVQKNGVEPEVTNGTGMDENGAEEKPVDDSKEEELEPLIVEAEDKSDVIESENSPVLTGRVTRQQAKNSPAPKHDYNGTDKMLSQVKVSLMRVEEEKFDRSESKTNETESKTIEIESETETKTDDVDDKFDDVLVIEENGQEVDVTNASVFVNFGNDTTKNFDITTTSGVDDDTVRNSFLESAKDISYGETLRGLSGRRMLRGSRESPYMTRYKTEKDVSDGLRKSYVPHISSVKRKSHESPEDSSKRFKNDDSPGLLSYISSPINSFRSKLSRSEIPSSTPKLTSYKFQHQGSSNVIDDMSKIDLEEKNQIEPNKKWCSIM